MSITTSLPTRVANVAGDPGIPLELAEVARDYENQVAARGHAIIEKFKDELRQKDQAIVA